MEAPDELTPKQRSADLIGDMYEDLRHLAAHKMAHEAPGQTISATVLVHEAYLRITQCEENPRWLSRGQFYLAAAEAMRRILIDRARRKKAARHGGDLHRDAFDSVVAPAEAPQKSEELLALDEALEQLGKQNPRKARLVELRFFVGLTSEEAAEVLEISKPTADRDWAYARAWLLREIGDFDP